MTETRLTDKQEAFVSWYCKLLNATRAAERAGYTGNGHTLEQIGHENLSKPEIRAEIDRRLRANIPSADETLTLITSTATLDITPYLREDGTLDVQALAAAGHGRQIKGVKPGREGVEITLRDPDAATKMLARYHRLLDRHMDVDLHTSTSLEAEDLATLAQQIVVAQQNASNDDDAQ